MESIGNGFLHGLHGSFCSSWKLSGIGLGLTCNLFCIKVLKVLCSLQRPDDHKKGMGINRSEVISGKHKASLM